MRKSVAITTTITFAFLKETSTHRPTSVAYDVALLVYQVSVVIVFHTCRAKLLVEQILKNAARRKRTDSIRRTAKLPWCLLKTYVSGEIINYSLRFRFRFSQTDEILAKTAVVFSILPHEC
jgi:hypothetical protein